MIHRILIVCVGNICRSPMAEVVLRHHLGGEDSPILVESAGLAALVGNPIDPLAETVLAGHGHTGRDHVARQVTEEMISKADLVLAMQRRHLGAIHAIAPQARGKSYLVGKWEGDSEIPDPYGKTRPVFEDAYGQLDRMLHAWRMHL